MTRQLLFATAILCSIGRAALAQGAPQAANTSAPPVVEVAVPPVAESPAPTVADNAVVLENSKDYRIGPEDVLDISVWKSPELSRMVPVRPDGKVSLPLVNDIQAAGLTPNDLRDQLTARLAEFIPEPEVAVIVREVRSIKVAVVGSVKTPGRYELKSAATVLELLALAQGLSDFASSDRIVVLRQNNGQTMRIPFNYRKVTAGDKGHEDLVVQAGDIIMVP